MATAENAKLQYEAGQNAVAMSALTNSGDETTFTSAAALWSGRGGFAPVVRPNGVLTGFAVIAAIIGLGWIIARVNLLGPGADQVLSRLAFFVLTPLLLLTVLSEADVSRLFSSLIPISAIAAVSPTFTANCGAATQDFFAPVSMST